MPNQIAICYHMKELVPQIARFSLPEIYEYIACFKMITGNSQGICTKQKTGEVFYLTLLRSQGCNAPFQIIQCAKFGACARGWPPTC